MNKVDKQVGEIFRQRRRELNWTQEYLGKKLGVAYSTVACWERGIRGMGLDNFFKCCDILGLEPDQVYSLVRKNKEYSFTNENKKRKL